MLVSERQSPLLGGGRDRCLLEKDQEQLFERRFRRDQALRLG
jgi:hypothetical protein